jgi:hypothetical protein
MSTATKDDKKKTEPAPDPELRQLVRNTLENAAAYKKLPVAKQQSLAHNLTRVVNFLEDPHAGLGDEVQSVARALDQQKSDPAADLRARIAKDPTQAGAGFQAGAANQGVAAIGQAVQKVDFVKFVSGLIDGVFNSIVNSSIKQMQAFADFLENVVKSVGEFANDNVSDNNARDALVGQYPQALKIDNSTAGQPKLAVQDNVDDNNMPDFKSALGVDANLDDEEGEKMIVQAQKLQMARQRQRLLSQILLMGLNRIIVTDGEIKASVLFDVNSEDTSNKEDTASMYDANTHFDRSSSRSFWGTDSQTAVNTTVSTANADDKTTSASKLDMHTKLSGSVTVKFKSDVFPLEKFATGDQMSAIGTGGGGESGGGSGGEKK